MPRRCGPRATWPEGGCTWPRARAPSRGFASCPATSSPAGSRRCRWWRFPASPGRGSSRWSRPGCSTTPSPTTSCPRSGRRRSRRSAWTAGRAAARAWRLRVGRAQGLPGASRRARRPGAPPPQPIRPGRGRVDPALHARLRAGSATRSRRSTTSGGSRWSRRSGRRRRGTTSTGCSSPRWDSRSRGSTRRRGAPPARWASCRSSPPPGSGWAFPTSCRSRRTRSPAPPTWRSCGATTSRNRASSWRTASTSRWPPTTPARPASPGCGARRRTRGLDPDVWFGNVELEAYREIGQETPRYVENIVRYYVAYRLASEMAARKATP